MKPYLYKFEAMSTPCEVLLFSESKASADKVAQAVLVEVKRLEQKYNYYDSDSLLSQLNNRETNIVDMETKNLLERAKQYYKKTNGIFDITVATFKPLYSQNLTLEELAAKKEALLPFTGCEHFSLKKGKILFDNDTIMIDLGGFVKEYSVDRSVAILIDSSIATKHRHIIL